MRKRKFIMAMWESIAKSRDVWERESRVDTSRLSRALQGEGGGERREDRAEPGAAAMRPKGTKIEGKQNGCTIQGRAAEAPGWRSSG